MGLLSDKSTYRTLIDFCVFVWSLLDKSTYRSSKISMSGCRLKMSSMRIWCLIMVSYDNLMGNWTFSSSISRYSALCVKPLSSIVLSAIWYIMACFVSLSWNFGRKVYIRSVRSLYNIILVCIAVRYLLFLFGRWWISGVMWQIPFVLPTTFN